MSCCVASGGTESLVVVPQVSYRRHTELLDRNGFSQSADTVTSSSACSCDEVRGQMAVYIQ